MKVFLFIVLVLGGYGYYIVECSFRKSSVWFRVCFGIVVVWFVGLFDGLILVFFEGVYSFSGVEFGAVFLL